MCIPSPLQTRPGTENDDFDELMQTYVCTPSSPQTTSPTAKKDTPPEPDPEASLITDFQVVTDIRVSETNCTCSFNPEGPLFYNHS